jgi:16S rRNA (adenine1518-N6/adenine1519-N6)-dimethyltransferase
VAELLTPTRARELLQRHDLAARRSLGQHFLVDPNTVRRIVRLAGIRPDETILEIGPGLGSLTLGLAEAAARVVAVELDEGITAALREVVANAPHVEIVTADAMRTDLGALVGRGARLVANLPYNIATPLFARVLDDTPAVTGGLVMVQREVGERWTAPPGSKTYGAISVKVAYHADARIVGAVPATVFMPPPAVESALCAFRRRPRPRVDVADAGAFFSFVESAFAHRRKTIRNALVTAGLDRKRVEDALGRVLVDANTRPEQLTIESFADLYDATLG